MNSQIFKEFKVVAETSPSKPAISFKHINEFTSLTYGHVCAKAIQLGAFLALKNIKEGDAVALLIGNQPEWPIAFMALQYVGALAVPLDIKLPTQELTRLLAHCKAKAILYSIKLPLETKRCIEGLHTVQALMIDGEKPVTQMSNSFGEIKRDTLDSSVAKSAVFFYTSGTTDEPKAVVLSQENLLSNVRSIKKLGLLNEQDVVISFLPLHHTYSFMVTCLTPLLLGAQISYPASLTSDDLLGCMQKTGVSIVVGVPQFFTLFHKTIASGLRKKMFLMRWSIAAIAQCCWIVRKISKRNLSKHLFSAIHRPFGKALRYFVTGGAKLDEEILRDFFIWGFTIIEGYGLTETSPIVTLNPPGDPKIGSVGKSIPEVEVKIVGADDQGIGEVAIKGPNVMQGYYSLPDATQAVMKDGWFHTQDLGRVDAQGYLYLTGRKDDLIVLASGKKINPEEVEKAYSKTPYIKEICVVSALGAGGQAEEKQLMAVIVVDEDYLREKGVVNIEETIRWQLDNLTHQVTSYNRIKGFVIAKESLPRTALGKIMRYRVREKYFEKVKELPSVEQEGGEEDFATLPPLVCRKVLEYFSHRLKKKVRLSDHIELDLGLDSLARIEILLELQKLLNIEVPDWLAIELFSTYTIKDLMLKIQPYLPQEFTQGSEEGLAWHEIIGTEPSEATLRELRVNPTLADTLFSLVVYGFFRALWMILFRLEVKGEKFPEKGPYIIFANHTSYFDPVIVAIAMPFDVFLRTFFLGFKQIFYVPVLKRLIKSIRFIPIDVSSFDLVNSLQVCAYLLRNARNICMFPEGQRSPENKVIKFKKGIGILAQELDVALVPVYIQGAYESWSRHRKLPRLSKITVTVGKKCRLSELVSESGLKSKEYEDIAESLRLELIKLSPASNV